MLGVRITTLTFSYWYIHYVFRWRSLWILASRAAITLDKNTPWDRIVSWCWSFCQPYLILESLNLLFWLDSLQVKCLDWSLCSFNGYTQTISSFFWINQHFERGDNQGSSVELEALHACFQYIINSYQNSRSGKEWVDLRSTILVALNTICYISKLPTVCPLAWIGNE